MEKQYRKVSELKNWDKNPRSITPQSFQRLKKHLQKLGQYKPLIITNDGIVLGGNMRLAAYRDMGVEQAWVSVVEADTEEKKIEYALSDNDRMGQYEADQLADMIGNFPNVEWDDFAVDLEEPLLVKTLMDKYKDLKEDEVPEVSDGTPISQPGEVYKLGRHTLMCGSATNGEDVYKLLGDNEVQMTFTDPPYNMNYTGGANSRRQGIENDNMTDEQFKTLLYESIKHIVQRTKGGIYICMHPKELTNLHTAFTTNGGHFQSYVIWVKNTATLGGSDYQHQYEPILYGWNKNITHHYFVDERNLTDTWHEIDKNIRFEDGKTYITVGDIKLQFEGKVKGKMIENNVKNDIWHIPKPTKSESHPTMKPIALVGRAILNSTKEGDSIYDPFGGSGTTLIAAEQTGRTCYMMELDPKYCDVIRKRYELSLKK